MTPAEQEAVMALISNIHRDLVDAHLEMEDRTEHCFDKELGKAYHAIDDAKTTIKQMGDSDGS